MRKTVSYLKQKSFVVSLDVERPPAFGPLLLEQIHSGHCPVGFQHAQIALLGCLGSPGELVQVEHDRPKKVILGE